MSDKSQTYFFLEMLNATTQTTWFAFLIGWLVFVFTGTIFYTYYDGLGWWLGFFNAVDVGYQIGFCYNITRTKGSKFFDVFYLLVGTIFVFAVIVFIFEMFVNTRHKWFSKYLRLRLEIQKPPESILDQIWEYCNNYFYTLSAWIIVFYLVVLGTIWSCYYVGWTVVDGVYFSFSTLVRCGLNFIPNDSPDWYYGFAGLYAMIGCIVLGVAIFLFAENILDGLRYDRAETALKERATKEELHFLRAIASDGDDDADMTKNEFLLLVVTRLGLIDVEMIQYVYAHFDEIATDENSASKSLRLMMDSLQEIGPRHRSMSEGDINQIFSSKEKKRSSMSGQGFTDMDSHHGLQEQQRRPLDAFRSSKGRLESRHFSVSMPDMGLTVSVASTASAASPSSVKPTYLNGVGDGDDDAQPLIHSMDAAGDDEESPDEECGF